MDSATNGVVLERLHLEALIDDALASDGCITVDHDRYDLLAILVLPA